MPTLLHQDKLNEFLSMGVQVGAGVKGTGYKTQDGDATNKGQGVWTIRIKFPKQAVVYRTTGVKYSPDDAGGKREASKIAYTIFGAYSDKFYRGVDYTRINYIVNVADRYMVYLDECSTLNEASIERGDTTPPRKIIGGKSYWTEKKVKGARAIWSTYLDSFIKQLPKQNKTDPSPIIENVDPRDLDKLDEYIIQVNPKLAIETRLKVITEFRHFLHWCYEERITDRVHQIKRPQRGGNTGARARMRKEITPEMYLEMVDYTRARYTGDNIPKSERDYAYLFHLWFLIMANCGIRVPTSGLDHTLIRWEHLKKTSYNGKTQWTLKRKEKLHEYEAIILEPAHEYWSALESFYEERGINTKSGIVFVHPYTEYKMTKWNEREVDKDGNGIKDDKGRQKYTVKKATDYDAIYIEKGSPIKSFKARWETMCGHGTGGLGYNRSGTPLDRVPQSERVSPGSIRAWFITQRLYSSDDIKIELLARVVGSSIGQIEARYLRLDMNKSYEYLSAGAYDAKGKTAQYKNGYYVGRK